MDERSQSPADPAGPGDAGDRMGAATEAFVAHRNLLYTVAYQLLGLAADAEDILQETWLRWVGVDLDTVADQRAYLVRITTRQALSRLRTVRRRKESYVGPWLPEPLLTGPDVADDVELADTHRAGFQPWSAGFSGLSAASPMLRVCRAGVGERVVAAGAPPGGGRDR